MSWKLGIKHEIGGELRDELRGRTLDNYQITELKKLANEVTPILIKNYAIMMKYREALLKFYKNLKDYELLEEKISLTEPNELRNGKISASKKMLIVQIKECIDGLKGVEDVIRLQMPDAEKVFDATNENFINIERFERWHIDILDYEFVNHKEIYENFRSMFIEYIGYREGMWGENYVYKSKISRATSQIFNESKESNAKLNKLFMEFKNPKNNVDVDLELYEGLYEEIKKIRSKIKSLVVGSGALLVISQKENYPEVHKIMLNFAKYCESLELE